VRTSLLTTREARKRLLNPDHANPKKTSLQALYATHLDAGVVDESNQLTLGMQPFNVFARIGNDAMPGEKKNDGVEWLGAEQENEKLGSFKNKFMVAANRPVNDENWESKDEKWLGTASMGRRHRFLILRGDTDWWKHNIAVFGLKPDNDGNVNPATQREARREAIALVEEMVEAAKTYVSNRKPTWAGGTEEDQLGLYFHCHPHASVTSLHMHMVDLTVTGPTHAVFDYKNLSANEVLKALKAELEQEQSFRI
jgi:hypothetical protein